MSALDTLDFQPMLITDVFTEYRQSPAWLNTNQVIDGRVQYPHVTNTALGNSVARFIAPQTAVPNRGNAITIGIDTQVVAYQPVPFYGATKVFELRAPSLNAVNAQPLVTLLRRAIEKFSWGYKASTARLTRTRLMVPVITDLNGTKNVDWDGLEKLGRELHDVTIARMQDALQTEESEKKTLPALTFEPMFITDVFEVMEAARKWFDVRNADRSGSTAYPYIARSGEGNGVGAFLPYQGFAPPNRGNAITIGVSTSTVFYQPVAFYTGKEIQVVRHPNLNEANGPFLVTLLRQQMKKFKWGNGASLVRLRATRIMVPVTVDADGNTIVDWAGMSQYGRALRRHAENNITLGLAPINKSPTHKPGVSTGV